LGCSSAPVDDDPFQGDGASDQGDSGDGGDDFAADEGGDGGGDGEAMPDDVANAEDEIATDTMDSNKNADSGDAVVEAPPQQEEKTTTDASLDDEFKNLDADAGKQATNEIPPPDDFVQKNNSSSNSAANSMKSGVGEKSVIKNIRYEENDGGGTVIIEADAPMTYTTRFNDQTKQFVVEVENTKLPKNLKRPYNTRDFNSSVGSVDAYQSPGSDVARVVVQMRDGATEPSVQQEGNSILVVTGSKGMPLADSGDLSTDINADGGGDMGGGGDDDDSTPQISRRGILSANSLQEFMSSNMKFYGKKISIEVKDIPIRDAINLLAEESGANLVLSESVSGSLSLKLRKVPWDQALIMILRAKKLAYTRQGNILRITAMSEIKAEEEEAMKFAESKRKADPLVIQMIPVNYAKIGELQGQIASLSSERGKVVSDSRTSAIIVTDTEEVIERIKKMVSSLDIPPAQVLIEGKIVEARETFEKKVGIQWDMYGTENTIGNNANGPSTLTPSLSISPGINKGTSLGFQLRIGNLDVLGDLNAMLSLEEREDNVKIISSPRIVTLHNEKASIVQSSQIPIITSSESADLKTRSRNATFKNIKMNLDVTPQVANNGNVILDVNVQREFLGAIVDEDTGAAPIHSREAKTKVMVRNGQTAVIGGIYQNDASNNEAGVPFLKDIPILGFFFRSDNYRKDKTELLLFLTPRILSQIGTTQVSGKEMSNLGVE
jgi:type IV pilus assembly protein PilQ